MHAHFGEHVTIDGYGGSEELLNDQSVVLSCLDQLPELLGMHKMSTPEIYHSDGNDIKDPGGWTGVVTIAESHISVHTFPKRGFVSADVYTCKNGMDTQFIIDFFTKAFELKDVETNFLKRGTRYPAENIY
jgi:S-adenosylmethionine decarboxylase